MTTLKTGSLEIPKQKLQPWLGQIKNGSTVASLSDTIPMVFGEGQWMTFDIGEAEYVGEGAKKGASTVDATPHTVKPYKFHKTLRWTEEVMWADEDHQMGVVDQILDLVQPALSRALDFGVLHGSDGLGNALSGATAVDTTGNTVEAKPSTDKPYVALDAADTAVLADGFVPRDVALDTAWASEFSTVRTKQTEQKMYPDFELSTSVSSLDGHRASVSSTVGGTAAQGLTETYFGFVGDFSAVRWGIQRQIGLEVIRYGDPDGGGDLKRNNEVAFRAEVVYGYGIADLNAFAAVTNSTQG